MRSVTTSLLGLALLITPLIAGGLWVEVSSPAANKEAIANHAVLVVRTTACHSPEQTTLIATAEGLKDGARKSIPLKLIPLSTPGTFAVSRQWSDGGAWAIKVIATNPEFKDYSTSAVVPVEKDTAQLGAARHYSHVPSESELVASLN